MAIRFSDLLFFKQRQSSHQNSSSPEMAAFAISLIVTAFMLVLNATGCFQALEWLVLDRYFRIRPITEETDPRILIITIDEPDLSRLQQWPLSDQKLANLLTQINQYNPQVIGLDIYRDFSVPPGKSDLEEVFRNTPNLFGVEKVGGTPVPPPPVLAEQERVAMADVAMDNDGNVRRALLSASENGNVQPTLGAAVALYYLGQKGILPKEVPGTDITQLGEVSFPRLQTNDGGYIRVDNTGYQILLNYRGPDSLFETVSITDVLENRVSTELLRDRIVLIGSIAPSLNDFVYTPYGISELTGTTQSPGVAIHAHTTSQIVSAVLDGRPLLRTWPTAVEWGWVFLWCSVGCGLILIPRSSRRNDLTAFLSLMLPTLGLGASLLAVNGILFFNNVWVPSVPALLGIVTSATAGLTTRNLKLIQDAYVDGLTKVLNRRAFNQHMADAQKQTKDLAVILCDVDCFKGFNDFYGHPMGDDCLQKVAKAIQQAVRPQDIVARYGGEEFAVILHAVSVEKACDAAERMCEKVQSLKIPHARSKVSPYVSISCGVAVRVENSHRPLTQILVQADKSLYQAKRTGRNRVACLKSDNTDISV